MSRQIDFTQPLDAADAAFVADRPWLIQDAELAGIEVQYLEEDFEAEDEEEEEEEETDEYDDLDNSALNKLIATRNDEPGRNEATTIVPESRRKEDLQAALRADDARQAAAE